MSKHALASIRPSATTFLTYSALWSGNNAQRIYPHRLQPHSEIYLEAILRPFCLVARKHGPKIGVAHLVIFCYLPHITAFCAPTALHLISIRQYAQSTVEKIRLFSYFSNPVALLKSGRAASLSRPILASQYTHSHYYDGPRLRNYSSRFRQLIRANQDLLLGLSVGRVTEYGGTTPPVEGTNCAKTR